MDYLEAVRGSGPQHAADPLRRSMLLAYGALRRHHHLVRAWIILGVAGTAFGAAATILVLAAVRWTG